MIPVTKTFLPPIEEYTAYLNGIWQRYWLTNNGPLVNELELKLKGHLGVSNILYVTSGTIALQIAIKALELKGEIITSPFSFVATTSAICWEGCKPVMVDIDPTTFNIDTSKIESAITPRTSAIVATHVFGNPCNIEAIDLIAKRHNLKVIYDAAHCFGTVYNGKSVFEFGDISITSFHTSKLYHTIEGGAIFSSDFDLISKMAFIRNFGFNGPENFSLLGINGKNSEFHAAMGLANLKYSNAILEKRKNDFLYYNEKLKHIIKESQVLNENLTKYNYSFFPFLFRSEEQLLRTVSLFREYLIFPRRYFHPPLHKLNYIDQYTCDNCTSISSRVLCLPMYYQLSKEEQNLVIKLLLQAVNEVE